MRTAILSAAIISFVGVLGCDSSAPSTPTTPATSTTPSVPITPVAPGTAVSPATPAAPNAADQSGAAAAGAALTGGLPGIPGAAGTDAPTAPTESVVAEVSVGKKGRSLDEYEGAVVTPAKSLFAARERLTFEVSVPHALNLFNATEGRMPKSHDEFMQRIIKENNINLPELPEGHQYRWDPAQKELMVDRPKKAAPAGQP